MKIFQPKSGFTIVELIVVVTVIIILAIVGVVSYGTWRNSVYEAAVKSDLQNAAAAMEDARNFGENGYAEEVQNIFSESENVDLWGGSEDGGETYCIDGVSEFNWSIEYYIDSATKDAGPQEGTCADRPVAPSIPSGLSASAVSGTQINLSWSALSNADSYTIQRASSSTFGDAQTVGTETDTSFESTGLSELTTYHYRIRANNEVGSSEWSGGVSATTLEAGFSNLAWTQRTSAGLRAWSDVASSADGTRLVATVNGGYIYTSADGGATWTERTGAGSRYWYGVASSSDGMSLAAIVADPFNGSLTDYVYTSTDGGASWTTRTASGSQRRADIVISADGQKLVTVPWWGYPQISGDGGATWTTVSSTGYQNWRGLAMSDNGNRVIGVASSNPVHISTDAGASWTATTIGTVQWYEAASSADGLELIIAPYGNQGPLRTSTNGGSSWTERPDTSDCWTGLTMSSNGTKIAASSSMCGDGYVLLSLDGGATWEQDTSMGRASWVGLDGSNDGRKLVIVSNSRYFGGEFTGTGYIYTGQYSD